MAILLVPAFLAARKSHKRMQVSNTLKNLVLAMHNYHERCGTFPPAYIADESGRPMHSWRVLLLPELQEQALYDQYDFSQPWDAPQNLEVAKKMPTIFQNPYRRTNGKTCFVVVTGDETNFAGAEPARFSSLLGGSAKALAPALIVEVSAEEFDWTDPTDLAFDELTLEINQGGSKQLNSRIGDGILVGMNDGSIQPIPASTSKDKVRALFARPQRLAAQPMVEP